MIVQVYAVCDRIGPQHPEAPPPQWWFEVEFEPGESVQDGPEVIHTDGMYATPDEAIAAGNAWAASRGHEIGPFPEDMR